MRLGFEAALFLKAELDGPNMFKKRMIRLAFILWGCCLLIPHSVSGEVSLSPEDLFSSHGLSFGRTEKPWAATEAQLSIFKNWAPASFLRWAEERAVREHSETDLVLKEVLETIRYYQWMTVVYLVQMENRSYRGLPVTIASSKGEVLQSVSILGLALKRAKFMEQVENPGSAWSLLSLEEILNVPLRANAEEVIALETLESGRRAVAGGRSFRANSLLSDLIEKGWDGGESDFKRLLKIVIEETLHFMETEEEAASLRHHKFESLGARWEKEKRWGIPSQVEIILAHFEETGLLLAS